MTTGLMRRGTTDTTARDVNQFERCRVPCHVILATGALQYLLMYLVQYCCDTINSRTDV